MASLPPRLFIFFISSSFSFIINRFKKKNLRDNNNQYEVFTYLKKTKTYLLKEIIYFLKSSNYALSLAVSILFLLKHRRFKTKKIIF